MNDILSEKDTLLVQKILTQQLDVAPEQLVLEARIEEDLMADSLDKVEISLALEESFDFTIPDDQWDEVKTIGELYAAVAELLERTRQPSRGR
jgi:acyl carrier protein